MSFKSLASGIKNKSITLAGLQTGTTNSFPSITDQSSTGNIRLGLEKPTGSSSQTSNNITGVSKSDLSKTSGAGINVSGGSKGTPRDLSKSSSSSNTSGRTINFVPGVTEPPWPNELEPYASYNSIFTLAVLSPEEINNPNETYRINGAKNVILRSGGGLGDSKTKTVFEKTGRIEYYIDDIEIEGYIAPNTYTGISNSTSIRFIVREPYSLGLFLQTLKLAALNAGYSNYVECPMLLTIEFIGWDENNNSQLSPYSRRMIPIKLSGATVEAGEGGSVYNVSGYAYNGMAFLDDVQELKHDVSITGSDLLNLLQVGPNSLTSVINERYLELETTKQNVKSDRIIIMFPEDRTSRNNLFSTASTASATTKSTISTKDAIRQTSTVGTNDVVSKNAEEILSPTFRRLYSNSDLAQELANQARTNVNAIGREKIIENWYESGEMPYALPLATYDESKGGYVRHSNFLQVSNDLRKFEFTAGTKIEHIIQQLILISGFGRKLIDQLENVSSDGFVNWFRIESQVFIDAEPGQVMKSGQYPKIYVFRVVPFKTHHSRFKQITQTSIGMSSLQAKAAKNYNYIYTGKNKDILDFKLNFDLAFFTAISSDTSQTGSNQRAGAQNEAIRQKKTTIKRTDPTGSSVDAAGSPGTNEQSSIPMMNMQQGANIETPESRVAREFHNAFMNSNADLITVDMTIMGDPYYIYDSGLGNYVEEDINGGRFFNMKSGGSMNYENGEVDVNLIFRTPIDYNDQGTMDFPRVGKKDTEIIVGFSGLYQVVTVVSKWNQNLFTQDLRMIRRKDQEDAINQINTGVVTKGTLDDNVLKNLLSGLPPDY